MVSRPKKKKVAGKNRGGRPRIQNEADKRDALVRVLTTAAEREELKVAAGHAGMSVSLWMRLVGLERARALAAEKEAARERREQ